MLQSREKYFDNLAILPAALRSYIPKELLKNVDIEGCFDQDMLQYVQKVFDNSNDSLRMYGNAESLLLSLNDYMEFPLSRKMFPLGMGNYYSTIPSFYQNLKKEVLYCKQDFLFYLQSCVYAELELHDDEQKLKFAELIEYMRKHEERLSGCYEFVKYDHGVFEDIRKSFICSRSLYVFPEKAVVTAVTRGERIVTSYEETDFVKVFDNLISKYPCLFLPNSETKDKNATAVVRIFDDGGFKFVMESELFAAINLKNPDHKPLECMDIEGHYRTIDYKNVLERYRDKIGDIDKYRYFMSLKLFRKLREELEEFWKPIEDKPMKRVRNVGPRGFTLEDLKKELKYLGYTEIFHEITAEARVVYTYLSHLHKPDQLETMHMYKAVQDSITRVMFKRYPCFNEFMYRQKVCSHVPPKPCDHCLKAIKEAEARIEAEIKAESEQASSSVTAKTSEDDIKKEEDSAELNAESVTSEALLQVKRDPENLKSPVESSFAEAETRPIPAISESEVSDHNPVLSSSNNHKMPRESFSKATKESEFEQAFSKQSKVTSVAPSVALNNPVGAESNPLPANSESKVPEHDTVLPDYNTHVCEKCMETSNETREEVKQTYRKMIILEKTLKEKDAELERLRVYEEKLKKSDETEKNMKGLKKEAEEWKMKHFKILEENEKLRNMLKSTGSSKALESQIKEKDEQFKKAQKAFEEKKQRCKELEKTIKEKEEEVRNLTEAEKWEIQNKEDYKATVKELDLQIKRNASKYADEIKKLTAEKERTENLLKRSNKGLLEKLQKSESSLKEMINRLTHLETDVTEKNRMILELQKSAENQVSEQEKTKKELETQISTIRGMLDAISPPESNSKEKPDTECLICLEEMRRDQKKLKCEHCRKIVHLECASEWLKNHRSCAHCRREQLDPTEFPSLR